MEDKGESFWSQEKIGNLFGGNPILKKNCWKDSIGLNLEIPRLPFIELEDCTASVGGLRLATTPTFPAFQASRPWRKMRRRPVLEHQYGLSVCVRWLEVVHFYTNHILVII